MSTLSLFFVAPRSIFSFDLGGLIDFFGTFSISAFGFRPLTLSSLLSSSRVVSRSVKRVHSYYSLLVKNQHFFSLFFLDEKESRNGIILLWVAQIVQLLLGEKL